jgi:uncharacterized membrane protein
MRRPKDYLLLYFKGVSMGGADVIPGVSGGTIAFITGIYEELIDSLKAIDGRAIGKLLRLDLGGFWTHINGSFLITVLAGILTSLLSLARLMTYLLEHHPIAIWSFFFGLILVSSPLIMRDIHRWHMNRSGLPGGDCHRLCHNGTVAHGNTNEPFFHFLLWGIGDLRHDSARHFRRLCPVAVGQV